MRRCLFGLLLSMIFWPAAGAQPRRLERGLPDYFRAFQSHEQKQNLTRVVLRNRLRTVVEEYPLFPLAAVATCVPFDGEPQGCSVLAELKGQALARDIDLLGGVTDYGADAESLFFVTTVPELNLEKALQLHARLLSNQRYEISEIQQAGTFSGLSDPSGGSPETAALGELRRMLASSPGAERESGMPTPEQMEQLQLRLFVPSNVVIAVSGAPLRERVLSKVVELYAGQAAGQTTAERAQSTAPRAGGLQYVHRKGGVKDPLVAIGFSVPGVPLEDRRALQLLSCLLGRGRSSLLAGRLMGPEPAVFGVRSLYDTSRAPGLFALLARPEPGQVDTAEVRVLAELEAIREAGVSGPPLDRAKAIWLKDFYETQAGVDGRALALAVGEVYGNYLAREQAVDQIVQMGSEAIQRVIGKYLSRSAAAVVELFPESAEARTFSLESFRETMDLLVPVEVQRRAAELSSFADAEPVASFEVPAVKVSYIKPALRKTSVLRGPQIYLQEQHTAPVVYLMFLFPGGRINETEDTAGITELLLDSLLAQAGQPGHPIQWEPLERSGMSIAPLNEPDYFGFAVQTLSGDLEPQLAPLIRWIRDLRIDEATFERAHQGFLRKLRGQSDDPSDDLEDRVRQSLFSGHPYARGPWGSEAVAASLTFAQVEEWRRLHLEKIHPIILIHGDVEGTSLLQRFVSQLSDAAFESRDAVEKDAFPEEVPAPVHQSAGSLVLFGFPVSKATSYQSEIADVLVSVLNDGISEERVLPRHESFVQGGIVFVRVQSGAAQGGPDAERTLKEIRGLFQQDLPSVRFLNALVETITRFHIRRQHAAQAMKELAVYALAGAETDYLEKYLISIRQMPPDDLTSLSREILGEE